LSANRCRLGIAARGKDDAPAFSGHDDRYGHRVYAGLILNTKR
jgi:hypothetical protein